MDKGTSGYFFIIFGVILCINLPFIVCDFYYANQFGCQSFIVDGFSFSLSTWLKVEGAFRCVITGLFLVLAIIGCKSAERALKAFVFFVGFAFLYALFSFVWMIVGSIMFWGKLNSYGICDSGVSGYMFALLIIGYIGIFGNILLRRNQNNNQA